MLNDLANDLIEHPAVNLFDYPGADPDYPASARNQFTLGDLHGNALKLLYALVRLNVFVMSAADYRAFVRLYTQPAEQLNKAHILRLKRILANIKVQDVAALRLLGDELCDRGSNDYFTLKIIEKLHDAHVHVEILFSNHGLNFVEAIETIDQTRRDPHLYLTAPCLEGQFTRSLNNLKKLVTNRVIPEGEILDIVNRCYRPYLNAISYTLTDDSITLYSHAPVGLETIQALAFNLGINYRDETAKELAQTIDQINAHIENNYTRKNRIRNLYDPKSMFDGYCGEYIDFTKQPIAAAVWNREYQHLVRPEQRRNYKVYFVHGHDSEEKTHQNIYGMDDVFGKAYHNGSYLEEGEKGQFQYLHTTAAPSPRTRNLFSKPGFFTRILDAVAGFLRSAVEWAFSIFKKIPAARPAVVVNETTRTIHSVLTQDSAIDLELGLSAPSVLPDNVKTAQPYSANEQRIPPPPVASPKRKN